MLKLGQAANNGSNFHNKAGWWQQAALEEQTRLLHALTGNICTVESLLSRRLSLRFSPTGLDFGLTLEELPEFAEGLHAAVTADPVQGAASMLVLFSTFALMVCRLRADGGGRSPKSFKKKKDVAFVSFQKQIQMFGIVKVENSTEAKTKHRTYLFIGVQQKTEKLMVLFGNRWRHCWTGWWLCLYLCWVFIYSFLNDGWRIIWTAVLEQPVQNLMSLCECTVGRGALRGSGWVWRVRQWCAVDAVTGFTSSSIAIMELTGSGVTHLWGRRKGGFNRVLVPFFWGFHWWRPCRGAGGCTGLSLMDRRRQERPRGAAAGTASTVATRMLPVEATSTVQSPCWGMDAWCWRRERISCYPGASS